MNKTIKYTELSLDHKDLDNLTAKARLLFDEVKHKYSLVNILNEIDSTETDNGKTKIKLKDGTICKYLNYELHCDDNYAVVTPNGDKFLFVKGKLCSLPICGKYIPSVIMESEQITAYHNNGLFHSYHDMPALSVGHFKMWFRMGFVHRPHPKPISYDSTKYAIIHPDFKAWFNDNKKTEAFATPIKKLYTQEEVDLLIKEALAERNRKLIEFINQ